MNLIFYFTFRLLGDGRGLSAGPLPVFRAERMERQSLVESHIMIALLYNVLFSASQ